MKIRYRLVYNYNNHLNKQGMAPVAIELRQGKNRTYVSSHVLLFPHQWADGKVANHPNQYRLTAYLYRWMHRIEDIEIDYLLKGKTMTLSQLKSAYREGIHASATLRDFTDAVITNDSSRCKTTKRSYKYLVNDLEAAYGSLTISDITYDLIVKYRESQRRKGLSENTIKGRLKALRCLLHEATKRDVIDKNPFDRITIGNIGGRKGGLTSAEVRRIEGLNLEGREAKVRDMFLIACYTGLRFGDLSTLEEAYISNGILVKTMHKTHHDVVLPIGILFNGKPLEIISRYKDVRELSHCCCNAQANKILKDIAVKARIGKRLYMHVGRKTFGQMLSAMGMSMSDISELMGHAETRTTKTHYVFEETARVNKSVKRIFKGNKTI